MNRTIEKEKIEEGRSPPPAETERESERQRARAYLDLWERHLIHAAVNGPFPAERGPH